MGPCKDMQLALLHHALARTVTGPSRHRGQDTKLCSRHALLAELVASALSTASPPGLNPRIPMSLAMQWVSYLCAAPCPCPGCPW